MTGAEAPTRSARPSQAALAGELTRAEAAAAGHRRPTSTRCSTPSSTAPAARCWRRASARRPAPRWAGLLHGRRLRSTPPTGASWWSSCATRPRPRTMHGMQVAEGILTARGGLASHAADRGPRVGHPGGRGRRRRVQIGDGPVHRRRRHRPRGRRDLARRRHRRGRARGAGHGRARSRRPSSGTLLGWADEVRAGHLGVRANADNGDGRRARPAGFGAEGIGLCRTEHMFLGRGPPADRAGA